MSCKLAVPIAIEVEDVEEQAKQNKNRKVKVFASISFTKGMNVPWEVRGVMGQPDHAERARVTDTYGVKAYWFVGFVDAMNFVTLNGYEHFEDDLVKKCAACMPDGVRASEGVVLSKLVPHPEATG